MLQNATPLRKSAPGPPNSSDEHVSCTARATRNASCQILCICPTPAIVLETATKPSCFAHFWLGARQGAQSLALATRNDKVLGPPQLFALLTWQFASRHSGMRFFDISTSNCAPNQSVFDIFDFEMCVAPHPSVFDTLTSKCASRHDGVHFFDISTSNCAPNQSVFDTFDFEMCLAPQRRAIFHLSSGQPAPAALASLLFDPPETQILEKHSVSRLSYLFAHLDLFSETFSFWSSFFFSSLLFSDSSHLCFSSVHVVGSLTSKLPSTIFYLKRGLNRHPLIKRAKKPKFF